MASDFYSLNAKTPAGRNVSFSDYEGKVVLVVNTATQCGFTPQFEGLEKLYEEYKDRGLVVIGFPCNQFGGQEPLTNATMEQTCKLNYGVTFPLFEKTEVNGDRAHPVFRYLKSKLGGLFGRRIKWNFTKFLVDRNGKPVKRFAPVTRPEAIEPWIKSLLSLLLVLAAIVPKADAQNGRATGGDDIVIGKIEKIHSNALNEDRTVWVHVPQGYNKAKDSARRYPVIYLMDGSDHFTSVVGMVHRLSEASWNDLCPDMIVVGIPNTDRMRDLTPSHVGGGPYASAEMVRTSGGGEAFTRFIAQELIPHIDSLYPTAPFRMLIGHSLGGLMVVNTLINHRDLFSAYLAIDPSLWWDDQRLLHQAEGELRSGRFNGKTLFLAIANTMQPGMDTLHVKDDTARNSLHIRSILRFENDLGNDKGNGLRWGYKYYNDDSHGSVPLIAEYDALRFIFDFYHFAEQPRLSDPNCSPDSALHLLTAHYRTISGGLGFPLLPPHDVVTGIARNFLQNNMPEKAFVFYTFATQTYPQDLDGWVGMGDYYAAKNDKKKAIEYYNKALTVGHDPQWVKDKMEKLQNTNVK